VTSANHAGGLYANSDDQPLTQPSKPRIWPIPLILAASLAFYFLASILAVFIAALAVHGRVTPAMVRDIGFINSLTESQIGFPLIVVIPQVAMTIPALIAAFVSPIGFRQRLNLTMGHWPVWLWCLAAMATPLIGLISSVVVGLFMEDSKSLVEMSKIFRDLANNGFLLPLAFLIGATPGVCEELLFRGYVQSRLTTRFSGAVGIFLTSIIFAVFHMDLVHSTAVFALGVWLGWIAWQSGSLFPAMLAHFVNNALSVLAVSLGPEKAPGVEDQLDQASVVMGLVMLTVMFTAFMSLVVTIVSAWRYRLGSDILVDSSTPSAAGADEASVEPSTPLSS
jgi:membrane protease YdiL (CAAX protease family)